MKESKLRSLDMVKITKIILDFMFISGIVVLVTLPYSLKLAGEYYSEAFVEHYISMVAVFGLSALLGLFIIRELRCMMKTVMEKACFVYRNVQSLERMGMVSICISILFFIKMFLVPTPATFIIILVFFVAALFCGVLAQVFAEAVRYKEENDLTI
ncbi:MAG: DUF2975 domain-containing protein [Lachnospiraceae bacterium]|nr:DUF2975 domain-containing protein [Lachnospiraceae bacterium]MDD3617413.1 DUF2975 domain-containing protein [Lachnospiraceae bacterium]